jgi:hypothetical protein
MAYEYYMTRRFSSTSELNNFLNGTELKAGSVVYDDASSGTLTDASGGFGTNTYNTKRLVISSVSTEFTVGSTTSDTVIVPSAETGLVNGTTYAYKIYNNDEIASTAIVSIQQDHSNLWVLVYKTDTAGF